MKITHLLVCCAAVFSVAPVQAAPVCHPIAASKIQRMWTAYSSEPGAAVIPGGSSFQCVGIDRKYQVVCRTRRGHPAHPSIVIRTAVEKRGGIVVHTEADTAATCSAFLDLMREYDALTSATLKGL